MKKITRDLTQSRPTLELGISNDRNAIFHARQEIETIPACRACQGDGCPICLGTGLTELDCDFRGLSLKQGSDVLEHLVTRGRYENPRSQKRVISL